MISFFICGFSILMFIVAIFSRENKVKKIRIFFSLINISYKKIVNSQGKIFEKLFVLIFLLILVEMGIMSYLTVIHKTGSVLGVKTIGLTIIVFLFIFVCMYFIFGIPLLVVYKMEELTNSIRNRNISTDFLISFSILIVYSFFFLIGKDEMIKYNFLIFTGLIISYVLNIKILISVIMNPLCFFTTENNQVEKDIKKSYILKITISGAIVLLALIIVNLFLSVLMTSYTWMGSFYCSVPNQIISEFDLFYYTIMTFTTIGYGDIVPRIFQSKVISIIIALTSVLCLVIFISSVISIKDKLKDEEEFKN